MNHQEHVLLAHQNQHWDSDSLWEQFVELIYLYDSSLLRGLFNICWVIFAGNFIERNKKNIPSGSIYLIPEILI